jgi:serine/threonine protein kinase
MMRRRFIDSLVGKKLTRVRVRFPSGKHSVPLLIRAGENKFVFKKSSLGKGLTLRQARTMVSAVKRYHNQLTKAGINVSEVNMIRPMPDPARKGKYFVASLEQYMGRRNASDMIRSLPAEKAEDVYRKVLTEVTKALAFPSKKGEGFAGLLIDSKPKNYVLSADGRVSLVDFYTPKLLDAKGRLYPYFPNLHPTRNLTELQTRFEEKNAIVHILLAHAIADRPELRKQFETITLQHLRKAGQASVANYLAEAMRTDYIRPDIIKQETIQKIKRA